MQNITDSDYKHNKRSDTLLLKDLSENFRKKCLEIQELDPAKKFFSSRINLASSIKKDPSKTGIMN